jgi:lipopolysaccharide transport system permease protein
MSELQTPFESEVDEDLEYVGDREPSQAAVQQRRAARADEDTYASEAEDESPPSAEATRSEHYLMIRPTSGWRALDVVELWRRRELMYFFVWRDLKLRYKQTVLGAFWAIVQPLLTTGLFAILFNLLMGRSRVPTVPDTPYFVCTFCAMLPWQLFAFALQHSGNSLVHNHRMVQKIYFPRLVIPISAVFSGLADFCIGFLALLVMIVVADVNFTWRMATAPLFIALALSASVGAGLWLSSLNAIYRDFRFIIPFIVQFGMFISPVIYATSSIDGKLANIHPWLAKLYWFNPLTGAIEGFRWSMLENAPAPGLMIIPSTIATIVLLVTGIFYFKRMERTFADVI